MTLERLLSRYHEGGLVIRRLCPIETDLDCYTFHSDGSTEAQQWVECRLLALLNGRSGGEIAKSLRAMIKTHGLDANAAKPVVRDDATEYVRSLPAAPRNLAAMIGQLIGPRAMTPLHGDSELATRW